ncbi:MAG: DUF4230 domain-containing protein [Thermoflexales bacterium]
MGAPRVCGCLQQSCSTHTYDGSQRCHTRVYDRTNLLILEESKELESQAREKATQAIRETALESGLLEEVQTRARLAIEQLLHAAGYERVEFVE